MAKSKSAPKAKPKPAVEVTSAAEVDTEGMSDAGGPEVPVSDEVSDDPALFTEVALAAETDDDTAVSDAVDTGTAPSAPALTLPVDIDQVEGYEEAETEASIDGGQAPSLEMEPTAEPEDDSDGMAEEAIEEAISGGTAPELSLDIELVSEEAPD